MHVRVAPFRVALSGGISVTINKYSSLNLYIRKVPGDWHSRVNIINPGVDISLQSFAMAFAKSFIGLQVSAAPGVSKCALWIYLLKIFID